MAKYIRDYTITFLTDGDSSSKLVYTTIDKKNPLHITFSASYDVGKPTASAELSVYNMSPASRRLLQSQDVKVMIEVGTRDVARLDDSPSMSKIFIGTVSEPLHTNTTNSDHVTRIKATSGYDIKEVVLDNRIEGSVTKLGVIEKICADIESKCYGMVRFNLSYLKNSEGSTNKTRNKLLEDLKEVHPDGYSYTGSAQNCLNEVIRDLLLESSIKSDGTIKLHKQSHSEGLEVFNIDQSNGLLTIPQPVANKTGQANSDPRVVKGYSFKTLLLPQLSVNDRVNVNHPAFNINSDLIVQSVKFSGGYESSQWYSTIKANFESDEDAEKNIAEYSLGSDQNINYYKLLTGESS